MARTELDRVRALSPSGLLYDTPAVLVDAIKLIHTQKMPFQQGEPEPECSSPGNRGAGTGLETETVYHTGVSLFPRARYRVNWPRRGWNPRDANTSRWLLPVHRELPEQVRSLEMLRRH